MKDILKCYVAGRCIADREKEGIVSFAIPEIGVLFRCAAEGTRADLEIIAFLSFLRFAEHNLDIFKKRELHIFSDFPLLVYLMNEGQVPLAGADAIVRQAQKYAKKLVYKVKWIGQKDNRAVDSVMGIPHMPVNCQLKIKTFANLNLQKPADDAAPELKM